MYRYIKSASGNSTPNDLKSAIEKFINSEDTPTHTTFFEREDLCDAIKKYYYEDKEEYIRNKYTPSVLSETVSLLKSYGFKVNSKNLEIHIAINWDFGWDCAVFCFIRKDSVFCPDPDGSYFDIFDIKSDVLEDKCGMFRWSAHPSNLYLGYLDPFHRSIKDRINEYDDEFIQSQEFIQKIKSFDIENLVEQSIKIYYKQVEQNLSLLEDFCNSGDVPKISEERGEKKENAVIIDYDTTYETLKNQKPGIDGLPIEILDVDALINCYLENPEGFLSLMKNRLTPYGYQKVKKILKEKISKYDYKIHGYDYERAFINVQKGIISSIKSFNLKGLVFNTSSVQLTIKYNFRKSLGEEDYQHNVEEIEKLLLSIPAVADVNIQTLNLYTKFIVYWNMDSQDTQPSYIPDFS